MIPYTGRPCWYDMAVECSDVVSNSSLELSWFGLSTPGYDLNNKARRGWENHVLVNRSVLRQETSRTACVFQSSRWPFIRWFTWSPLLPTYCCPHFVHVIRQTILIVLQLVLHISFMVAPDPDFAICLGIIILQILHLALPHGRVSPSGSSSRISGLSLACTKRSRRLLWPYDAVQLENKSHSEKNTPSDMFNEDSDHSLRCPYDDTWLPWLSRMLSMKILIRLRECAGWSESSLGALVRMFVFWQRINQLLSCKIKLWTVSY